MSRAEPMGDNRRAMSYGLAGGVRRHTWTLRQWRRWRHKHNRAHGSYFGHWTGGKQEPTPSRKDAVAARLEARRG